MVKGFLVCAVGPAATDRRMDASADGVAGTFQRRRPAPAAALPAAAQVLPPSVLESIETTAAGGTRSDFQVMTCELPALQVSPPAGERRVSVAGWLAWQGSPVRRRARRAIRGRLAAIF